MFEFEASHPLHTHTRSTSYIYNAFQLFLLRPVVVRMQPEQPDIYMLGLSVTVAVVGNSLGLSLVA
jgi:hypothetical protein